MLTATSAAQVARHAYKRSTMRRAMAHEYAEQEVHTRGVIHGGGSGVAAEGQVTAARRHSEAVAAARRAPAPRRAAAVRACR